MSNKPAAKKKAAKKPAPIVEQVMEEQQEIPAAQLEQGKESTPSPENQEFSASEVGAGEPDLSVLDDISDDGIDAAEADASKTPTQKEEEEKIEQSKLSPSEATKAGGALIVQGMQATVAMVPELDSYFSDEMVNAGAPKVGALMLKHQSQVPVGIAKVFAEWREEIMFGFWLGGVGVGAYVHYNRVVRSQGAEHETEES